MTRYVETQYKRAGIDDWRPGPRVPEGEADTVTIDGLEQTVPYDVRVRVVDDEQSQPGPWTLRSAVLPWVPDTTPPTPEDVRLERGCLHWSPAGASEETEYAIRSHPGQNQHFDSAEPAHEGLWRSPPMPLCSVPTGARTFLVRAVDRYGNESAEAVLYTERSPQSDQHAHVVQERDAVTEGWSGTIKGATAIGDELKGTAYAGDIPAFPPGHEPAFLVGDEPAFGPLESDAFTRFVGTDLPAFPDDVSLPAFGPQYPDIVYITGITTCLGDAAAKLTAEVTTAAKTWRLYWRTHDEPSFPDNPKSEAFPSDTSEAAFPAKTDWSLWSGAVAIPRPTTIEFMVWIPGGLVRPVLSGLSLRLSLPGKVEVVQGLAVPVGGTRVPLTGTWRKVLHCDPVVHQAQSGAATLASRTVDLDHTRGPHVAVVDGSGDPSSGTVDVVVRGY